MNEQEKNDLLAALNVERPGKKAFDIEPGLETLGLSLNQRLRLDRLAAINNYLKGILSPEVFGLVTEVNELSLDILLEQLGHGK